MLKQYHSKMYFISCFSSNPVCTDIMEIYNAVEEMDDEDEVCLTEVV